MVVNPQRVVLLVMALCAVEFGAVYGRYPECNGVSISGNSITSTTAGCAQAPAWLAPVLLAIALLATGLACRRLPGDNADRGVRTSAAAGVAVIVLGYTVVLFALVRPGITDVDQINDVLCGRPFRELGWSGDDAYVRTCGELAEGRFLAAGATAALTLVALVVLWRRYRTARSQSPDEEHERTRR